MGPVEHSGSVRAPWRTVTDGLPLTVAELHHLRTSFGRLARALRQQPGTELSYSLVSLLLTVSRGQPISPKDLAAAERIRPPSLTRSLHRLEQLGLVRRHAHCEDGRIISVSLTRSGERECAEILRSREVWLADRLAELTPSDLGALIAALPALDRLVVATPVAPRHSSRSRRQEDGST